MVGLYRPCHDWALPVTKPMSLAEVKRTERCAVEPTPRWTARDRRMGSPLAFLERARRLKADSAQAVVVLHAFAGARRVGDIEERMIHWASIMNVVLLIESADMAFNAEWDLGNPHTIKILMDMVLMGLLDIVLGGAPCATWSRLRFLPGGPRPLRFRGALAWGRLDLTPNELEAVKEANLLMVNFIGLCEALGLRGGMFVFEHPEDPELEPYPSVFDTDTFKNMMVRVGGILDKIHQCMYGGPAKKGTGIAHNCHLLSKGALTCTGGHAHGPSSGLNDQGIWHSRRLQTYPPPMCDWLSWGAMSWARLKMDFGPSNTGWGFAPRRAGWGWSSSNSE